MSAPTRAEVWSRIAAAGIVTGEVPPHRPRVPWYVRLLQGVTGWLGALFLLAFLGVSATAVDGGSSSCVSATSTSVSALLLLESGCLLRG